MKHKDTWWVRIGIGVLGISAFLITLGGCTTARIPATSLEVPLLDIPLPAVLRGENDLRSRTWTKAFQILHERMKHEYAYGIVKEIDWDALYTQFGAEVMAAEETKDREAWYRALRGYVYAIPDGNVQIDVNEALRVAEVGASTGLALAQLADGTVVVCGLLPDGPAALSGIARGAVIAAWDGQPIDSALEQTSIIWADAPAATPQTRRRQQLVWLPRASEGTRSDVVFVNPGESEASTVTLEHVLDDYATLSLYRPGWEPLELFSSPVSHKTLEGGYRYIRIAAVAPTLSTPFPQRDFRAAIRAAIDAEVPGIILDLRGTQGGDSTLAPKFLSSFVEESTYFETPGIWDEKLETFVAKTDAPILVEPQLPAYLGAVVVLVDGYTMGPAESMARFLKGRENVQLCGLSGTYGAPGVPAVELTLPGNYMIFYPDRQSLDQEGNPMGVANQDGVGNIHPDIAIPLDSDVFTAIYVDGHDPVLERAVALLGS